jgi:RHS repeat-associated protein
MFTMKYATSIIRILSAGLLLLAGTAQATLVTRAGAHITEGGYASALNRNRASIGDANGNRKTVTDPDGLVTTYDYDALNRVGTVTNAQGVTEYAYDRSSLKTGVNYPNGTRAEWTYDAAGRVETIENRQSGAVVSSYEYDYDRNGNRTRQVEVNGAGEEITTYDFDNLDRLKQVTYPDKTTAYTYDAAYNRKTETTTAGGETAEDKTYSYNKRNQVEAITDSVSGEQIEYAYDNNGNRTQKTVTPAAAGTQITTDFVYDVRDQLRSITQGGSSIGQFLYDYQGLRIRKQVPGETVRYVYDDQSVLVQTDELGNTLAKYDYGPDRLLSLDHTTEGAQFYLFDALGSVVNLTRSDGAIQKRNQYDAWGNYRAQVGSSENVFGFTGHEMDQESGLIYMKARFYDPELGLFLSHDAFEGSVDTPPSLHKYLYAFGNPTVFIDLSGLAAVPVLTGDIFPETDAFGSIRVVDTGNQVLDEVLAAGASIANLPAAAGNLGIATLSLPSIAISKATGKPVEQVDREIVATLASTGPAAPLLLTGNTVVGGSSARFGLSNLRQAAKLGRRTPGATQTVSSAHRIERVDDLPPPFVDASAVKKGEQTLVESSSKPGVSVNANGSPVPQPKISTKSDTEEVVLSKFLEGKKRTEARRHAQEAVDEGCCTTGTIDRAGKEARRRQKLKGVKSEEGLDRDEFPPAVIKADNPDAFSVKLIDFSSNRSSGKALGDEIKLLPDGTRVKLVVPEE